MKYKTNPRKLWRSSLTNLRMHFTLRIKRRFKIKFAVARILHFHNLIGEENGWVRFGGLIIQTHWRNQMISTLYTYISRGRGGWNIGRKQISYAAWKRFSFEEMKRGEKENWLPLLVSYYPCDRVHSSIALRESENMFLRECRWSSSKRLQHDFIFYAGEARFSKVLWISNFQYSFS